MSIQGGLIQIINHRAKKAILADSCDTPFINELTNQFTDQSLLVACKALLEYTKRSLLLTAIILHDARRLLC